MDAMRNLSRKCTLKYVFIPLSFLLLPTLQHPDNFKNLLKMHVVKEKHKSMKNPTYKHWKT